MQSASDLKRPPRLTMEHQNILVDSDNQSRDLINSHSIIKYDIIKSLLPDMQPVIRESNYSNILKTSQLIQSQYREFNNSMNFFMQPLEISQIQNRQINSLQQEILSYLRVEVKRETVISQLIDAITYLSDDICASKIPSDEGNQTFNMLNLLKSQLLKEYKHINNNINLDTKLKFEYDQETCQIIQLLENILVTLKMPLKVVNHIYQTDESHLKMAYDIRLDQQTNLVARSNMWRQDLKQDPDQKQLKESLNFQQPYSLINSFKYDTFDPQIVPPNYRLERVRIYKQKKNNQSKQQLVHYQNRKILADNRLRIKGRFISKIEQSHFAQLLPEKNIFNKNNNLNIDIVSQKLKIGKTFNDIGYGTIRKEDIIGHISSLIKRKQQNYTLDNILMDSIRKKTKVFRIINDKDGTNN